MEIAMEKKNQWLDNYYFSIPQHVHDKGSD